MTRTSGALQPAVAPQLTVSSPLTPETPRIKISSKEDRRLLVSYWISFPEEAPGFPLGFGVTAWSIEDALGLLEGMGYTQFHSASLIAARVVRQPSDSGFRHVQENSGPIVFRGIWYPFLNVSTQHPPFTAVDTRSLPSIRQSSHSELDPSEEQ